MNIHGDLTSSLNKAISSLDHGVLGKKWLLPLSIHELNLCFLLHIPLMLL